MRSFIIALSLAGLFSVAGCNKSGTKPQQFSEEELANNPRANFQRGLDILQSPDKKTGAVDYNSAYLAFQKSANLNGGATASFNAGWTAEQLGRPADAEEHYRAAYTEDPTNEKAMFSLARVLNEQGKAGEAVELYKAHAEANPDNLEARNDYIDAMVKAGQYEQAIAEAQSILRRDPKNAAVYRNLSALYYAQNNFSMSQLTAEKALALDDSDPGVYNNMGVTHLIQGEEPKAIERFKMAKKLDSTNFEANMNLGFVALDSGDYKLAHDCFSAATTSNPGSIDAKLGLAVATRGIGEYKRAGEIYDEIISADKQNEQAYFNAATLNYKYTKEFSKALKYLQAFVDSKAGQISPTHEVFALMEKVNQAKEAEEEKKRQEAEKKRLEEERRKRNAELLAGMTAVIDSTRKKLTDFAACIDEASIEEVNMVLEQAAMVVEAEEVDMAPDVQSLLDAYVQGVDGAIEACDPSLKSQTGGAPPAEGAEGAEGDAMPEGEAPAEGAESEAPTEEPVDEAMPEAGEE